MSSLTGNKLIDNVLVGLSVLASAICLGTIIYSDKIFKKELPQDTIEKLKMLEEVKGAAYPEPFKLEKMTVNLLSRKNKLRYLDTIVHIVPFNSKDNDFFEDKKFEIIDIIIDVSGRMGPSEINTVLGKILYEDRIKKGINSVFGKNLVKDIFFSKFTVQ